MKNKPKVKTITWVSYILILLVIGVLVYLYYATSVFKSFSSPLAVRELLLGSGIWGALVYLGVFIISIPLPIPSEPIAIAGGYVYGVYLGTLLSIIAAVIGSLISFALARRFGRPLLEKFVHKHHLVHFMHIFKKRGPSTALISYMVPIFPADSLDFILGLSSISFTTFIWIVALGNIPRYFLVNFIGHDLYAGFTWKTILVLLICTIFFLVAVFREKFKRLFFKELKEVEGEVEKEVRKVEKEIKKVREEIKSVKRKKNHRKKRL